MKVCPQIGHRVTKVGPLVSARVSAIVFSISRLGMARLYSYRRERSVRVSQPPAPNVRGQRWNRRTPVWIIGLTNKPGSGQKARRLIKRQVGTLTRIAYGALANPGGDRERDVLQNRVSTRNDERGLRLHVVRRSGSQCRTSTARSAGLRLGSTAETQRDRISNPRPHEQSNPDRGEFRGLAAGQRRLGCRAQGLHQGVTRTRAVLGGRCCATR